MINEYKAKKYCREDISKIENYDKAIADKTQTWICHHRTEIWWNCSQKELIDNECYYNRKACELIFLTESEHKRLHGKTRTGEHNPFYGKTHSDETIKKIVKTHKGKIRSEETKKKMSKAQKARWAKT